MVARGSLSWLAATTLLVALAACGEDEAGAATDPAASGPTGEPAPATETATEAAGGGLPACEEVWQAGAMLPDDYAGCADGETTVEPEPLRCSSGQRIVTHAETYWAVPGAVVNETDGLDDDPAFRQAKLSCFG